MIYSPIFHQPAWAFRHGHCGERLPSQWTKLQRVSAERQLWGIEAGGARGLAAAVPELRGGWRSAGTLVWLVKWAPRMVEDPLELFVMGCHVMSLVSGSMIEIDFREWVTKPPEYIRI